MMLHAFSGSRPRLAAATLRIAAVCVGAILCLAPDLGAVNGVIRGRVELPTTGTRVVRRPSVSQVGPDRPSQGAEDADPPLSVVYLELGPTRAFEDVPATQRARMDQRQERFVPHLLAIRAGTVVDFPNSDPFYHNVFSLSPQHRFDLGRYAAGRSKSVRFTEPGIVRVFCDIHSHMSAFILVFAHRYFATTDAAGRYRLENVPPGTYTVTVWNEATAPESHQVTIPAAGGELEVNFAPARAGRSS